MVRTEYPDGKKVFYRGERGNRKVVRIEFSNEMQLTKVEHENMVNEKKTRRGKRGGKRKENKAVHNDVEREDLFCPISLDPMIDAVTASDGMTYSRRSISRWFRMGNTTSPLHGNELSHTNLVDNKKIASLAVLVS